MFKEHKKLIIITMIIILLPILVGLILWGRLPDMIPTHFGANGEPDGWSSKAFAVFGIPLIMAALQFICIFATNADPKKRNIGLKAFKIVLWVIPLTSIICFVAIYGFAMNLQINIGLIIMVFLGIVFIVLGNVLPKNGNNYTFGVRTPWALNDVANWNFSNRLGGYCFVIGGIILIILALFFQNLVLFFIVIALMTLIPFVGSYIYYLKHNDKAAQ